MSSAVHTHKELRHPDLEVRQVSYASLEATAMVQAANADLATRYRNYFADRGGKHNVGLQNPASCFVPPLGTFFVAFLHGLPVGCGGWTGYDTSGEVAELKKLYVDPAFRKHGIARRVLTEIEGSAARHGRLRMILEAGTEQQEALALYESRGYRLIDNYGYFRELPEVRSYGRHL
jgi:GNAT superfamily N-acetyltransferase